MKYQALLSSIIFTYAISAQAESFTEFVKQHTKETFETITGKSETNAFTLMNDFDQCNEKYPLSYGEYNQKCVARVLKKVQNEKQKNTKAMLDCFIALTVLELVASGCKDAKLPNVETNIKRSAVYPTSVTLGCLTAEQIMLQRMEIRIKDILKQAA